MLLLRICCFAVMISILTASNIITLTDENFMQKITDYKSAVVMFHVPWCGHCKNLAPEFEKTAKALKKSKSSVKLIKVDCSDNGKTTCSNFKIKGYPTLKMFKHGEMVSDYAGPKHAEGLVKHLKSSFIPGSIELISTDQADKFLTAEENSVIGFFEQTESKIETEFHRLADSMKDQYRFAHTYNNRLLTRYGYRNDIVIIRSPFLLNRLEPPHVKYEDQVSLYKMRSWVIEHYHGLVGVRNTLNMDEFRRPLVIVYYKLDFTGKGAGPSSYWRNRVMMSARKLASSNQTKVHFAVSDFVEYERELADLGLVTDGITPVASARDIHENRFVMSTPFSIENLERFVEELTTGALQPYVKSAAAPESNDGPVKIIVGRTFDELVSAADRHVLIHFHSPWCGECPRLETTFETLSEKVHGDKIVLAKMDAAKNDVPKQFVIKRFPAVFLIAKDAKMNPTLFDGKYEVKDLLNFLVKSVPEVRKKAVSSGKVQAPQNGASSARVEL